MGSLNLVNTIIRSWKEPALTVCGGNSAAITVWPKWNCWTHCTKRQNLPSTFLCLLTKTKTTTTRQLILTLTKWRPKEWYPDDLPSPPVPGSIYIACSFNWLISILDKTRRAHRKHVVDCSCPEIFFSSTAPFLSFLFFISLSFRVEKYKQLVTSILVKKLVRLRSIVLWQFLF